MSQHDYNLANQSGLNFRADLNNVLEAIATQNSGNAEPTTTFPFMPWVDTSGANPILKFRNAADSAWVTVGRVDLDNLGIGPTYVGTSAPSAPLAGQFWLDTSGSPKLLKMRSFDNDEWITLGDAELVNLGNMPKTGGAFSGAISFTNTDYMIVPVGTTAQRPGSPSAGMLRFNSTLTAFEGYNGTAWAPIGGGGFVVTTVQSVSEGGSISSSTTDNRQLRTVQGNGGPVSASATPFGNTGGWKDGTEITLIGASDSNTVTLTFNDASKGLVGNFSSLEITKYIMVTCVWNAELDRWILK